MTSAFGAPPIGLKCSRLEGRALCEVQQSSFLGIAGNSGYVIPESEIVRARAQRPAAGHRGGSYRLLLDLKSGGYPYPVLGDQSFAVVQTQADRLNGYLADPRASAIELRERLWLSVLVPFAPVALVLGIFGVATLVRKRRNASAADAAG